MIRSLVLVLMVALSPMVVAAEPADDGGLRHGFRAVKGDRELRTMKVALSKTFCVAMRRQTGPEERRHNLRDYISPAYLKKHNLEQGDLPMEIVPVLGIHNIQLADDGKTVLCIVNTQQNKDKHAIVLRMTEVDGRLYIDPVSPPNAQTGKFTPWMLHVKV